MPDVEFTNLLMVAVIALLAPLTLGLAPRLRLPAVVLEIVAGILVGPQVLGWVEVDLPVSIVALLGLAFLLFLAGLEIDVHQLRGQLLRLALLGYLVTLVLGIGVGTALDAVGWVGSPGLVAITLSATSLGLVVPVLKDAGRTESKVGQTVVAAASVADFAAIVLLSLLFSASDTSTGSRLVLLVSFAALVAATAVAATLVSRSTRLTTTLTTLQDTTAQIRVRAAVVLLVAFVALAEQFGLESILGAFMAGAVVGLVDRDSASHPHFRIKLEAIGYGFLIPVFFVTQRAAARPQRADGESVGTGPGAGVRGGAARRAWAPGTVVQQVPRPPIGGCRRTSPGDLAAVRRHRHADRRADRPDQRCHRSGAGVRRAPVGRGVSGARPRPSSYPAGGRGRPGVAGRISSRPAGRGCPRASCRGP